jgi:hypothetical protein
VNAPFCIIFLLNSSKVSKACFSICATSSLVACLPKDSVLLFTSNKSISANASLSNCFISCELNLITRLASCSKAALCAIVTFCGWEEDLF